MYTWILGAPDPEMSAIERLLADHSQRVLYAANGGHRVLARQAYDADGVIDPATGEVVEYRHGAAVVVECDLGRLWYSLCGHDEDDWFSPVQYGCDHHRKGDPGYGRPPVEFWQASSLGQVARLLRAEPTLDLLCAAAADHCLAAAYAGQCPGVSRRAVADYRLHQRAEWLAQGPGEGRDRQRAEAARCYYGRSPEDLDMGEVGEGGEPGEGCDEYCPTVGHTAHVEQPGRVRRWEYALQRAYEITEAVLVDAPRIDLAPCVHVIDLREVGPLPELPEVLARTGQCAMYRMDPPASARDTRVKVGVIGAGEGSAPGTAPVEAFLGGWAAAQGLTGVYPDHDGTTAGIRAAAARGYCGGYMAD